jgi:HD-GYP domain-containing protein (c-di-GMP phosphodiesterase class II)
MSLSQLLSAMSYALDLTEGQAPGHVLRSCAIGMRLAEGLGLGAEERSALYYALLLKDAGCSNNAARVASLFGADDFAVKRTFKLIDWQDRVRLAITAAGIVGRGRAMGTRLALLLNLARQSDATREMIEIRCHRGAGIARRMGFPGPTADAIQSLDEHWNGSGHPAGLRGEEIPRMARICSLAQTVEVFHAAQGVDAAIEMARQRRGTWFDPQLVGLLCDTRGDWAWWEELATPGLIDVIVALEPAAHERTIGTDELDDVAQAFGEIIDAKSPYTFQHSANVASYAAGIAAQVGMSSDGLRSIRRAGLLHDIGKLGVSNLILDKNGPLTPDERRAVEQHPLYTHQILTRVDAFRPFAWTAALHHERLDGTGYPWRLHGHALDREARILAVADVYEALTAERPYRAAMEPARAFDIIARDAGHRLDAQLVEALHAHVAGDQPRVSSSSTATAAPSSAAVL